MQGQDPDKFEGIFFKKRNAKNYAWQLNAESADFNTGQLYTVEKYKFSNNRSKSLKKSN